MSTNELPKAELDVMSCLWTSGPSTARQIREALKTRRPMAHASVCTLLKRLEEKGFVSREKSGVGKAFSYRAAVQPQRAARKLLAALVDRLFGGSSVAVVATLLESHPVSGDEIAELESLLAQLKANQTKDKKRARN